MPKRSMVHAVLMATICVLTTVIWALQRVSADEFTKINSNGTKFPAEIPSELLEKKFKIIIF